MLAATLCCATGCVREAVVENQLALAQDRERALAQASDLNIAEAALSAQLVELEALLHQSGDARDRELFALLDRGYSLMAEGFLEARRLEAIAAGETADAERERRRADDARARAAEYARLAGQAAVGAPSSPALPRELLSAAEEACKAKDSASYERVLTALLARSPRLPAERLRLALAQRLAMAWLRPPVAARCGFSAPPLPGRPAAVSG